MENTRDSEQREASVKVLLLSPIRYDPMILCSLDGTHLLKIEEDRRRILISG